MRDVRAYEGLIQRGDLGGVINYRGHYEHPRLAILTYSSGLLVRDAFGWGLKDYQVARAVAAFLGTLLVAAVTLINPAAGLFLALHSTEAVFTTRVYLEALPALSSTIAVFAYVKSRTSRQRRWFYLAAMALGITAASKYIYLVAGLAILPFLIWDYRRKPAQIVLFGAIVLVCFVFLNPYLWNDPVMRVRQSIEYHLAYSKGAAVVKSARPWWYELAYLALAEGFMKPLVWHISLNTLIFALSWFGLRSLYRASRVYVAWFAIAAAFLLVWPTKWNQYSLIFITPMCLSAGYATMGLLKLLQTRAQQLRLSVFPKRADSARLYPIANYQIRDQSEL